MIVFKGREEMVVDIPRSVNIECHSMSEETLGLVHSVDFSLLRTQQEIRWLASRIAAGHLPKLRTVTMHRVWPGEPVPYEAACVVLESSPELTHVALWQFQEVCVTACLPYCSVRTLCRLKCLAFCAHSRDKRMCSSP